MSLTSAVVGAGVLTMVLQAITVAAETTAVKRTIRRRWDISLINASAMAGLAVSIGFLYVIPLLMYQNYRHFEPNKKSKISISWGDQEGSKINLFFLTFLQLLSSFARREIFDK